MSTSSSAIFGLLLRAGYISGKEHTDTKKEIVDARFKKPDDFTTGRVAETLHRGKDGKKVEIPITRKAADDQVGTYDHDRAIAPHHDVPISPSVFADVAVTTSPAYTPTTTKSTGTDARKAAVAFGACSTACSKDILGGGESGSDSEKERVNESRTPLQHLGLALYNATGEKHVGNVTGCKVTGNLIDKENFEHEIGEVCQGPGLWTKRVGGRHFHTSLLKNQTGARVYLKIRQVHEGHERREKELQRGRRAEEENVGFGIGKYSCEQERGIGKYACEKEKIAQDLQQELRAAEDTLLLLLEMRP